MSFLYDYQYEAVSKMRNGCILNGGVGTGKSRTSLYFFFVTYGGKIEPSYKPMYNPPDLYIITTARKRDIKEWEGELVPFLFGPSDIDGLYKSKVVIDSWNNIQKYKTVKDAFFIFDEDRVTGSGAWVKAFYKITKHNQWIILSATPGDTWMDYIPVFLANGFYQTKTEFYSRHVVFSRFTKYPKVERYLNTRKLERLRRKILVSMEVKKHTIRHDISIACNYDVDLYKWVVKNRKDPDKKIPLRSASEVCLALRRIVNRDSSRADHILRLVRSHPKMIIFYSFDYERDILLNLPYPKGFELAEWTGYAHQPLPTGDHWVYLVNYNAGAEGWNCVTTDTVVFYSQTYSYKTLEQAKGRIDRINTRFTDLYYYHLRSTASIDLGIKRALNNKKKFNAGNFCSTI